MITEEEAGNANTDREVDEVTEGAGDEAGLTQITEGDEGTDGDEGENEAAASTGTGTGDIVPAEYRARYKELGGTCGDFIATELSSLIEQGGLDALNRVKEENNIPLAKWTTLNNGQQRMNLSNTLRASFMRGEMISIDGKQYSLEALRDEMLSSDGESVDSFDASNRETVDKFLNFSSLPVTDRNAAAVKKFFYDGPRKAIEKAEREEKARKTTEEKAAEKAAKVEAEKKRREEANAEKSEKAKKAAEEKAAAATAKKAEDGDKAAAAVAKKAAAAEKAAAAKEAKAAKEAAKAE